VDLLNLKESPNLVIWHFTLHYVVCNVSGNYTVSLAPHFSLFILLTLFPTAV